MAAKYNYNNTPNFRNEKQRFLYLISSGSSGNIFVLKVVNIVNIVILFFKNIFDKHKNIC